MQAGVCQRRTGQARSINPRAHDQVQVVAGDLPETGLKAGTEASFEHVPPDVQRGP